MNHSPLQIDMVQQHPVIHLKLRTTADDLTLQLELDDGVEPHEAWLGNPVTTAFFTK